MNTEKFKMRIAFWLMQDSVRNWSSWIAGLYYVKNCLQALASLPVAEQPEVFAFAPESLVGKLTESTNLQHAAWLTIVPISDDLLAGRTGYEQLERLVASYACDLLFPAIKPPMVNVKSKVIGWIPDYQHKHYPEFFSEQELAYRDRMFAFLAGICDRVVCSSQTVEKDLCRFFPMAQERTFVLRFTAEPPQSAIEGNIQEVLDRFGIDQPFAYLPYQFWAHKNHQQVFEAWSLLQDRGHNILLVCSGATHDGRDPEHFKRLQALLTTRELNQVRILGMIDRHDQWQLYRGAKLVLQPSLLEGWSTSVEEAKSLGKPLLLSDIPVHREQVSDPNAFFQTGNVAALADLVESTWSNLPDGYDPISEKHALEKCRTQVLNFGRDLVKLFTLTKSSQREPMAEAVLPLYLYMQYEAEARLKVIEALSAELQRKAAEPQMATAKPASIPLRPLSKINHWFRSLGKTA
jgi:glycosyltransferase involved in cell wall biosynthesis